MASLVTYSNFYHNNGEPIIVGAFYYVWYGESRHWSEYPNSTTVDIPYTQYYKGYYSSLNETLITRQLKLIEEAGINFVIISWTSISSYEDNATKLVFKNIKNSHIKLKAAIMVEPVDDYDTNMTKYTQLKEYMINNFINPYNDNYLRWDNKPIIAFFVPLNPPKDLSMSIIVVGNQDYKNWQYWSIPPYISKDGVTSIIPRYDDSYLARANTIIIDQTYREHFSDEQWNFVIKNIQTIRMILITSWNEYHERTMIEPHIDHSASQYYENDYIYEKTKKYIHLVKNSHSVEIRPADPTLTAEICVNLAGSADNILASGTVYNIDFQSENAYQLFNMTFTVPPNATNGVELRLINHNEDCAILFIDKILVYDYTTKKMVYSERAVEKLRNGRGWLRATDAAATSSYVMFISASEENGQMLYGPNVVRDIYGNEILGKSYLVSFSIREISVR